MQCCYYNWFHYINKCAQNPANYSIINCEINYSQLQKHNIYENQIQLKTHSFLSILWVS